MKSRRMALAALLAAQALLNASAEASPVLAPQPTPCITVQFSARGDADWQNIALKVTNKCGRPVDFQNATISYEHRSALNTNFWGDFDPLPYPDGEAVIRSQKQANNTFLASLNLHFPTYPGASSKLPDGRSFVVRYGAPKEAHIEGSQRVYLNDVVAVGSLQLTNGAAKPAGVTQAYALIHLSKGGVKVGAIQLPWSGSQTIAGLAPASYQLAAERVVDSNGLAYQGLVTPAVISIVANQMAKASVSYTAAPQAGKLGIQVSAPPPVLVGYAGVPSVVVTQADTGSAQTVAAAWNATSMVGQLVDGKSYRLTGPTIAYNGSQCSPSFNPATVTASASTAPLSALSYTCVPSNLAQVSLLVKGGPASLASLQVTLSPTNQGAVVSQVVPLSGGNGSAVFSLPSGGIYQVSAAAVAGYVASFNPQPFTVYEQASATITLSASGPRGTPVDRHGQLKVCGTKLCNRDGVAVQLRGMSTHGLQWFGWGSCLSSAAFDTMSNDFGASVVRLSLYVQEGGYETDPVKFTQQVNLLINEASKRGLYALVDWHMLNPGDPNANLNHAKKFFTDIINANKGKVNLLFEIANEPNGVAWSGIKRYAEALIPVIRALDSKTPIIVGTPGWSSLGVSDGRSAQDIIDQPLAFENIMYTFHFYAASHRESYLNELDRASERLPIFVTEWGTQAYDGDGANDFVMSEKYIQLMARKQIGWTNWNFSDDFRSGAIWKTRTCAAGQWTDANLKPSGVWVKGKIKSP